VLTKIISGGQTGADIAGVDAAIELGLSYGGMLPKNRKCENGRVPESYTEFKESSSSSYLIRTERNVKQADGTVIFTFGRLSGGSDSTRVFAQRLGVPLLVIDLAPPAGFEMEQQMPEVLRLFIERFDIKVLNVAGGRESKHPGIYKAVKSFIIKALK